MLHTLFFRFLFGLGLLALLAALPLRSQGQRRAPVESSRAAIRDEALHSDVHSAPDGQGGLFLVWRRVAAGSTDASLIAQHINADGQLLWPSGVAVTTTAPGESPHVDRLAITDDGLGGCIVAWEEQRAGRHRVYLQRLSAAGLRMWPERGLPASVSAARQFRPALCSDYQGGVYVSWEEEVPGSTPGSTDRDVVAQRITPAGSYVFKPLGVAVSARTGLQQNVQLAATPSQGVIVLWEDFRNGAQWQLYAQQLSLDGRAQWTAGGISLAPPRQIAMRYPTVFADGFGGLVCVYEALGGLNLDRDLYAMRVNRSGAHVYHTPIAVRPADQTRPIVRKRAAEATVVWEDYRAGQADLYLQRFELATGESILARDGVPIAASPLEETGAVMAFTGLLGEPAVAWTERAAPGAPARLRLEKFDLNAKVMWGTRLNMPLANVAPQWPLAIAGTDRGGAWLSWLPAPDASERTPGGAPQLIGVRTDASRIGSLQPALESSSAQAIRLEHLSTTAGLHADAYLVWEDYRNGAKNPDLYLQRVDAQGRPRWRSGGIAVCAAPGLQQLPVLCAVPGGVVVGWIDRRTNDDNLYVQFVDTTGRIRWLADGLPLCIAPRSQSNLQLVRASAREVLAAWTDARALPTNGFDIYYQRLDLDGRMLLEQDGSPLASGPAYQNSVAAAGDGSGRVVLAWSEERASTYNLRAQQLLFGQPMWGAGVDVSPSAGQQRTPRVALSPIGTTWLTWSEERQPNLGQVYLALLDAQGNTRWGARRISPSSNPQVEPRVGLTGSEALVSWHDGRWLHTSGWHRQVLRVNLDGSSLWAGPADLGQYVPDLAVGSVTPAGEPRLVALMEESRLPPSTLALTRLEAYSGRALERGPLRSGRAEQHSAQLISMPGGRVLAAWLERSTAATGPATVGGNAATEARVLLLLLD